MKVMMANFNESIGNVKIAFISEQNAREDYVTRPSEFEGIVQCLYIIDGSKGVYLRGRSSDALWDKALKNTCDDIMIAGLRNMLGIDNDNSGIYVITNRDALLGAACILNKEALGRKLPHGKYYMIPSSIHEVLLRRVAPDLDQKTLEDMVKDVNSTVVSPSDVLSDKVYVIEI